MRYRLLAIGGLVLSIMLTACQKNQEPQNVSGDELHPAQNMHENVQPSQSDQNQIQEQNTSQKQLTVTLQPMTVALIKKAEKASQQMAFDDAEALYKAALSMNGECNYIWYMVGLNYTRKQNCLKAMDAFKRVASSPVVLSESFPPDLEVMGLPVFKDTLEINDAALKRIEELKNSMFCKSFF